MTKHDISLKKGCVQKTGKNKNKNKKSIHEPVSMTKTNS